MLDSSSPVSGDRSLPLQTRDRVRLEEKRKYVDQLKHEIAKANNRILLLNNEIKSRK